MSVATIASWREANLRYLLARLAIVRAALERRTRPSGTEPASAEALAQALDAATRALPAPAALDRVCGLFGLSDFERDVLLLAAGAELDPTFADLCGAALGRSRPASPTFALALALLPSPDWAAITPVAPLRGWRLLELRSDGALNDAALQIDERILHYLRGISYLDARLAASMQLAEAPADLPPSQRTLAREITASLSGPAPAPAIQLCGHGAASIRAAAASACDALDLQLHVLRSSALPASAAERAALGHLWEREALLANSVLLVEHDDPANDATARSFVERVAGPVLVSSEHALEVDRPTIRLALQKPAAAEQHALWTAALGEHAERLNGHLAELTAHFDLGEPEIQAASLQALASARQAGGSALVDGLWSACRVQARQRLHGLAQRIEPVAGWPALVLPEPQLQTLRDIVAHVRHRAKVYGEWGFAATGTRGLGMGALFAGPSGTGKTLAAEVIAHELGLDLYVVDLSQVVSKYIGETEKNLRRVFDAAQDGGAVLLFDEADALFGKRSDVKDSHDRYANIEVSYLLQRMEAYRGLAILTTNMKTLIDAAFLRRLRFVVQFPFPDATQRAALWRRAFPDGLPREGLQPDRLAQLSVSGGSIRNIALHASFYAAESREPVRMSHLARAALVECAKLEKGVAPQELRGWT